MINGLEGIPGSGKSYEAVVYHVLAALKSGRKVITNLPLLVDHFAAVDPAYRELLELRIRPMPVLGTWDANRVDDSGKGDAFLVGDTPPSPVLVANAYGSATVSGYSKLMPVFGNVWDYYSTWKDAKGRGPLFVIDECHVAMPRMGTHPHVIEWFKLHRHFNQDVLLGTQSFRQMSQDIAELMAMVIKVRKADILGRKDSYIRKVHAGYRGAVISTDERKYLPQYFPLYKSHTQGNSVAESEATDVKPMIVGFNRLKWGWLSMSAIAVVWAFWPSDKPKATPKHAQAVSKVVEAPTQALETISTTQPTSTNEQPIGINEMPEPYLSKGIHLTGKLQMGDRLIYTFTLSNNAVYVATVTSEDMRKVGYEFEALTDCAGSLKWKTKVRAITCDSPLGALVSMPQSINHNSSSKEL